MADQRFCPSCGSAVSAEERFCGNCGSRLPEPAAPPSETNPTVPVGRQAAPPTQILPPASAAPPTLILSPDQSDAPTQVLPVATPAPAPSATPEAESSPLNVPTDSPPSPPKKRGMPIWLIVLLSLGGVGILLCVIVFVAIALFLTPQTVITTSATEVAVTAGPGGIADLDNIPAAGNSEPTAASEEPTVAPTVAAPTAAPANSGAGGIVGGAVGGNNAVNSAATAEAATATAVQAEQAAIATAEIEQVYAGAQQLFYDEFVDNRNAWFTGVFQEIETDKIEDGVFKVIWAADGSSYELYEVREVTNFIAEVDCLIAQGDLDGSCGIVFGQRNDVGFYKYELFEDYYRLFIVRAEGEPEMLVEGDPAGIVRPDEPNSLRVIKRGDEIRLYLNEVLLETVNDASYPTGKVGVSTNSYREEGGVEIWFDNFAVWTLP